MHFFFAPSSSLKPLLLDELIGVTYTGAYSLRKISKYSTVAINVRRSSDDTAMDIGFVGGNLDTATMLSFVGAGNGFVTSWYDQSGLGRTAIQAVATKQPKIVTAGTLVTTANGKPGIKFASATVELLQTASTSIVGDANTLVFSHLETISRAATGNSNLWRYGAGGMALYLNSTGGFYYYSLFNGAILASTTVGDGDTGGVFTSRAGASGFVTRNGPTIATGNAGTTTTTSYFAIANGNSNYTTGEIICLTSGDETIRKKVEKSIANYYGVVIT